MFIAMNRFRVKSDSYLTASFLGIYTSKGKRKYGSRRRTRICSTCCCKLWIMAS